VVTVLFNGTSRGTTTAGEEGSWAFTPTTPLAAGAYSVTATAVDRAGNASVASTALKITLDTLVAAPSAPDLIAASDLGSSSTDNKTSLTTPTFTGTAEANSVVEVFATKTGPTPAAAVSLGTVKTTGTTTAWTFITPVESALADGTYSITAKTTDQAGNVSVASAALTPSLEIDSTVPTINSVTGPAPKKYLFGEVLEFEATFSEVVTVEAGTRDRDRPSIGVRIGDAVVQAVYQSGSGTTKLKFRTTVAAGQLDTDGIALDGILTIPSAATIRDAAGNKAATVFTPPSSFATVLVDGGPKATIVFSKVEKKATITFDRDVTGVDISDFRISGSSPEFAIPLTSLTSSSGQQYVGAVAITGSGKTYTLTLEKLPSQPGFYTLTLLALNSGIKDSANVILGANALGSEILP
jgi:hypothetical protein